MLYIRKIVLCCLVFCLCMPVFAKDQEVRSVLKTWTLPNDMGIADSGRVDTAFLNYPMRDVINDYSIANSYNGNLVSPIESKIWFDRKEDIDFLFARAYMPFILTSRKVQFYNVTTPYSKIAYKKGFGTYKEGNDIDFAFTGNLNSRTNLGLTANYLTSVGRYQNQAGKRFNGSIFGSYNGTHYGLHAAVMFNKLSNFENGGLQRPEELGGQIASGDLPVNLNAMSGYKYISGFLNHHYSICVERDKKISVPMDPSNPKGEMKDSIVIEYIPVTTFQHTFETNQSTKRYVEKAAQQGFYENNYFNTTQTNDSANELSIRNTLAVTFEEEFNKWLHFGATVFATNEFQRFGFTAPTDKPLYPDSSMLGLSISELTSRTLSLQTDTNMTAQWTNNTMIGGAIYKNTGKWVRYGFDGDVCLAGYKLGEFKINGHVNGVFPIGKDTLYLNAKAYVRNQKPNWFVQNYRSNHFTWNNNFNKTFRFYVGGEVSYPTKWVVPKVKVGFENLTNYIYFDSSGLPIQKEGNIQVIAVDATLNVIAKWFHFDHNVVWQKSTSDIIPLPDIALYANWYYLDCWFHALDVQIGVDLRYNTKYYAPLLNPATGQFCVQNEEKVGNYPIINVYASFYARAIRLKFFAQLQHLNQSMMRSHTYFSMPGYGYNPIVFRAGLAWHFYK